MKGGAGVDCFDLRAATNGRARFGDDTIIAGGDKAGEVIDLRGYGLVLGDTVTVSGGTGALINAGDLGSIPIVGLASPRFDTDFQLL